MEGNKMRKEYDFTNAQLNPYIKKLRKQISIRIDIDTINFFKKQAEETGRRNRYSLSKSNQFIFI